MGNSFKVKVYPGGATVTGTGSPIRVTGLTKGSTYTFTVIASNDIGDSPESAPSDPLYIPAIEMISESLTLSDTVSVSPTYTRSEAETLTLGDTLTFTTVPGAPTITGTTPSSDSIEVAFTPPSFNGNSAITYYKVYADDGTEYTNTGTSSPITVSGLAGSTLYDVWVTAFNAVGEGHPSSVTQETTSSPTVPEAPVMDTPSYGDQWAYISWSEPADGGSPILDYTVEWGIEGDTQSQNTYSVTYNNFTGLTNGETYIFKVRARNAVGSGAWSSTVYAYPTGGGPP